MITAVLFEEDIAKLQKEDLSSLVRKIGIDTILYIGNSIPTGVVQVFLELQSEGVSFQALSFGLQERELAEAFLIGQAYAQEGSLYVGQSFTKKGLALANSMQVSVSPLKAEKAGKEKKTAAKSSTKTAPAKKEKKEDAKEVKAKPSTEKVPTEKGKSEPVAEDTATVTSGIKKMIVFREFIESSSLSKIHKDFLCKPGNLTMLYDLIEKSKGQDALGFQLKMTFGTTGEELYPFVSKNFCKLREVLGS